MKGFATRGAGLFAGLMMLLLQANAGEGMWLPLLVDSLKLAEMQRMGFALGRGAIYSDKHESLKDAVVIFGEDTPLGLIQAIGPDVLAKGGDWTVDKIVGGEYVKGYGGQVVSIPLVQGLSTTALVERIRHGG